MTCSQLVGFTLNAFTVLILTTFKADLSDFLKLYYFFISFAFILYKPHTNLSLIMDNNLKLFSLMTGSRLVGFTLNAFTLLILTTFKADIVNQLFDIFISFPVIFNNISTLFVTFP